VHIEARKSLEYIGRTEDVSLSLELSLEQKIVLLWLLCYY